MTRDDDDDDDDDDADCAATVADVGVCVCVCVPAASSVAWSLTTRPPRDIPALHRYTPASDAPSKSATTSVT